jgi:hypothetical protein
METPCDFNLLESRVMAGDVGLYAMPNDEVDISCQFLRLIDVPDLRIRLGEISR